MLRQISETKASSALRCSLYPVEVQANILSHIYPAH